MLGDVIAMDRRRERRISVTGWAKVIARDPMRTFFGGAMEVLDVSPMGIGLLSEHPLEPGEEIEVRLAPFKVRGRIGRVVHCVAMAARPGLRLTGTDDDSDESAGPSVKQRYRIAVSYARHRAVA